MAEDDVVELELPEAVGEVDDEPEAELEDDAVGVRVTVDVDDDELDDEGVPVGLADEDEERD